MNNKILLGTLLIFGSTVLVGCGTSVPKDEIVKEIQQEQSIVDIVVKTEDVSVLKDIVVSLGLSDTLSSEGPFTVFAPTNKAFETLLADLNMTFDELAQNVELLRTITLYHVLEGYVPASAVMELDNESSVKTLNEESLTIYNTNGVKVNDSNFITTDISASNGVIHLIDAVLLPPTVVEAMESENMGTIIETAIDSGSFPTLVAAVQAAGLVDTLNGDGPFTVFAPSEEAFAQLLLDLNVTADELLDNTELLTSVLTYHVLPDIYMASDVVGLDGVTEFETVQGLNITIDPNNGEPKINESNIITADIETSNGVIHVIDKVLLPTQ